MTSNLVPPPLFTLRGHGTGVTALAYCDLFDMPILISGDQKGAVILWDLMTYRKYLILNVFSSSRIQSLKVVKFKRDPNCEIKNVLVVQSRDHGLFLLDLNRAYSSKISDESDSILAKYPSHESIFARGDSISIGKSKLGLLAYPADNKESAVTIRIVAIDGRLSNSATAQRDSHDPQESCRVFDISIVNRSEENNYYLFVAYEDGHLVCYNISIDFAIIVGDRDTLEAKEVVVQLISKFNPSFNEFVSAFDVVLSSTRLILVVGSPLNELVFLDTLADNMNKPRIDRVALRKQGTSAISIRPDHRLVAVAGWDNTVKLYSIKSRKLLAIMRNHSKQVQEMLFINKSNTLLSGLAANSRFSCNVEVNGDRSREVDEQFLLCCASMEGTISISSIY